MVNSSKTWTSSTLQEKLLIFLRSHQLINAGATVIVGYSGGPDSTALLHLLLSVQSKLDLQLIAAHFDHGWRPESGQDAAWCAEQAAKLGITFISCSTESVYPRPKFNGSLEAYGRALRQTWFTRLVADYPGAQVALAHHQDDQAETFFIRLIRGSSLEGLVGIRPADTIYIRPLLWARKAELLAWLTEQQIPFLHDPTNEQPTHLRNRLRLTALPALTASDSRFLDNLARTQEQLALADDYMTQTVQQIAAQISRATPEGYCIELAPLLSLHPYLRRRLLLFFMTQAGVNFTPSEGLLHEIERFLYQQGPGTHTLYQSWQIKKKEATILIYRIE